MEVSDGIGRALDVTKLIHKPKIYIDQAARIKILQFRPRPQPIPIVPNLLHLPRLGCNTQRWQ